MSDTFFPAARSIYIHWPFCPYKCHFCPFVAIASHDQFMERYNKALIKEIQKFCFQNSSKLTLDTIFLGGGTPSTWPDNLLLDTFDTLNNVFVFERDSEITIEVNPGTVTKPQLMLWKSIGINRLSIGVQSLKDTVLNNLNRKQSAHDVFWVLQEASALFNNISVDLILGLPGVSADEWKDLLAQVVTWPIKHVSIYFLTVHEETPLYFRIQKKEFSLPPDDSLVELYQWSIDFLQQHGLLQYEISNFAREGYQSRHNSVYWDRKAYKAFGLGACSFDGQSRYQNQKNLMKYMHDVEHDASVIVFCETLTPEQTYLETIMLGLRKKEGIDLHDIMQPLTSVQQEKVAATIELLQTNNFLQREDNRIVLTPMGLAVQNDIAIRLSL
jgi:oxygen-independent coproporphyrinogen III oxidase